MNIILLLFLLPLKTILAAEHVEINMRARNTVIIKELNHMPRKEKKCVKRTPTGDCREYDFTYGVQGVTCTEECIDFDPFDQCRLRNACKYDLKSGCFEKNSCEKISELHQCKQWKKELLCS